MPADEPGRDCPRCPRLVAFRNDNRAAEPAWHNAPVPSFGDDEARLLVVGLAPGLKGANRTGRPFTGDFAGDLLYATLIATGFARGTYDKRPDDGLRLVDCAITNAVRCVPPHNKPLPAEIATCRPYLSARLVEMPRLAAIVALGRIAHESVLRALGVKLTAAPFGHGARHALSRADGTAITLFDSYHCSRYNTSTRVLTEAMFNDVFVAVRAHIDAA
ncbi:Type-5 uracil-DNA glycosylase [Beijerinckiaceae bacterium RH AL1]|nr:uracil-DNA glycosylase [Beijerinckiaceae bacterium]VVB46263.1 Type-5 uracil-DNA glycosylase [Beijerinckiaceae bacterium RH CH11]VVB46348.1 Type-5 uracil-DNA glycosylase [Beijerinckiaceae bacterium RH AL8]VVC55286.1 Type-5 uracil-DNA glycosylase [Beijerinckiaceae bacterium RH AL1]